MSENKAIESFNGSGDANNLFFYFANVAVRGKGEGERVFKILDDLDREASDFFCQKFMTEGTIKKEALDFIKVKETLIKHFITVPEPQ